MVEVILECSAQARAPYALAAARAVARLTGHDLDAAAASATADAEPTLIRAGLAGITKQVAVYTLDPTRTAALTVIPFRWMATGASGELFPSLEANLTLRAAGDDNTEISLVGSYEPPFGKTGMLADRLLLRRVAERTLASFLGDLVEAVTTQALVETDPPAALHRRLELEPDA